MTVNTTLVWTLKDNVSASANRINNSLDKVGVRTKGATSALDKLGVATGGLVTPTSIAAAGTLAFAGIMVKATEAAVADEESQNRLAASLKANVPNWDGNTEAIEANISAKQRLGFSDEELRDSLTVLAGATHDVAEAQTVMNTAMDLARFKGIDLRTASEALIKVEGGAYRSLKQLGIKLKDNATSTEALAAVQAVAAGQAEAYGDTAAGAMAEAQIAVDELVEGFGKGLVPIVKDAAHVVTNYLVPSVDLLSSSLEKASDATNGLSDDWIATITTAMRPDKVIEFATSAGQAVTDFWDGFKAAPADARYSVVLDFERIASAADDTSGSLSDLANTSGDAANDMMEQWTKAADDLIGKAYDPQIEHEQLLADQVEISTLEQIASKRKLTAEERLRLDELHKSEADHLFALAEAGQTSSGAFEQGIADLKEQIGKATGPTKTYLQGVLDQLLLIKANSTIRLSFPTNVGNIGYIGGARASGGPVSSGGAYIVGEEGPEMFVPSSSGNIVPNDQLSRVSGGGVSEVHTHIYLDGRQIAESVDRHNADRLQRAPVTAGRV